MVTIYQIDRRMLDLYELSFYKTWLVADFLQVF